MTDFAAHFAEQRVRDIQSRVHNFVSNCGNALERIGIYIDEDELDDAKREIEELRAGLGRITDQTDTPTYVVIYDVACDDGENAAVDEEYYGYFASAEEAEQRFRYLSADAPHHYSNVKICMTVKDLSDAS